MRTATKQTIAFGFAAIVFVILALYCLTGFVMVGSFALVPTCSHERALFNKVFWGTGTVGSLIIAILLFRRVFQSFGLK